MWRNLPLHVRVSCLVGGALAVAVTASVANVAVGLVSAGLLFVAISVIIRRLLSPIDLLSAEKRCAATAALAAALEDRQRLSERLVSLQDLERKSIARELHDEFGPHLFALRVHAGAVMRVVEREPVNRASLSGHGAAILEQIDHLQQYGRRTLERLRPVELAELGLSGSIENMLRRWRETYHAISIESAISPELVRYSEAVELTVYRVVQEALTNVFRHAQATHVSVALTPVADREVDGHGSLIVRIHDNGLGFAADHHAGFGLVGMRERVWALGGTLTILSDRNGVTIEAAIPLMP